MAKLDNNETLRQVNACWEDSIVPALVDYVRIPNKSPAFDPDWAEHGHMEDAVTLIHEWCKKQPLDGFSSEVVRLPGRTPLIYMEVDATDPRDNTQPCVLLYGHLDKQPEMQGWREGLGPWIPVLEDDKLYGRGGADDGYAAFASLTAIATLQRQGVAHPRCVIIIEACEESGSYDLPPYIDHLAARIGTPKLVVCLDSGCGNYDQLWCTTSLRGLVGGTLRVETISEGVHSGDASGIVPSSFRVLRGLLDRLEDVHTGEVLPAELQVDIPEPRRRQAAHAAQVLGDRVYSKFPFHEGSQPVGTDLTELVLNRTWRSGLAITGAEGLPSISDAGNVMRPRTEVKVSLRIPPTLNAERAGAFLKTLFETSPPHGAKITFETEAAAGGWDAPPLVPWLESAAQAASQAFFERDAVYMGEGGAIPFMGLLGEKFPQAQFLITGVLGPASNAHGPNEFLHIPTGKRLTCCVAHILSTLTPASA
ncbi:MAG: M20 family metallopeptidase [Gammaproteobacteria bacterium]|nr:M20 family metallopeptidase [Gammaproteobacteria bacterium]